MHARDASKWSRLGRRSDGAHSSAPTTAPLAAYLRLSQTDRVVVEECSLRDYHRGPHRTYDGATWETGEDDYIPAPDGVA